MAIKTFTTGEVLTASDTNTFLANAGLVYITATTVTAQTTIAIDNCFTTTYAHYYITVNLTTSITGQYTALRLRAGGTPKAVNYNRFNFVATSGGVLVSDGAATAGTEFYLGGQSTTFLQGGYYLFSPQVSGNTGCVGQLLTTTQQYQGGGAQTETYSADGFQIFASGNAATYTGTVRVYGLRQA